MQRQEQEQEDWSKIIAKMFQGKTWAEVEWEIEEEEEKAKTAQDAARKALWMNQKYELEEGEIFE